MRGHKRGRDYGDPIRGLSRQRDSETEQVNPVQSQPQRLMLHDAGNLPNAWVWHAHELRSGGKKAGGGERGIRTLDTGFGPYTPLAGERLRPARPSLRVQEPVNLRCARRNEAQCRTARGPHYTQDVPGVRMGNVTGIESATNDPPQSMRAYAPARETGWSPRACPIGVREGEREGTRECYDTGQPLASSVAGSPWLPCSFSFWMR